MRILTSFLMAFILLVPIFGIGCKPSEPDWPAGCPHGEIWLPNVEDPDTPGAYFDLATGEIVYGDEAKKRGDIYIEKTFVAGNPALGIALHDAMGDSILYDKSAPGWGSELWKQPPDANTPARVSIYMGHNIWIHTGDGKTGKIKLLDTESNENYTSFNRVKIQWIYQPDGSGEFHDVAGAPEGTSGTK
ncbi:MAG: hypothetical protein ABIC40_01085 [bacterium]